MCKISNSLQHVQWFFLGLEEMGSAEQEVVIENILRLVPEDKVTTAVSCDVSNHVEDEKNTENNGIIALCLWFCRVFDRFCKKAN